MHTGGVADNNGPWSDEKDPFEVLFCLDFMEQYALLFKKNIKVALFLSKIKFSFLKVSLDLRNEN